MRKLVFFIAVIGMGISSYAQSWIDSLWLRYDSLQYDTLQTYPYLYKYNLPDTARHHDGMPCVLVESNSGCPGYTYYPGIIPGEFAVYQYTESPLTVYGIAFTGAYENWGGRYNLTIYDTAMNIMATDTADALGPWVFSDYFWTNVDTTKFHFFTLPGKKSANLNPLTDKVVLRFKYFDSNNPPVVVNGGFWVGVSTWTMYNPPSYALLCRLHEDHEPPYRINNLRVKWTNYGDAEWLNDTVLEGILPELFLIVAPPCPAVEGLTAVMDSAGTVEVSWDSTDTHREWVVEMYGPDLTVTDTVASCHWRHTGLYPSKPYWVKVNARCPGLDNHVWSGWSPRVHFGAPVSVDAAEAALPGLVLSPNPTDGLVTVSADCVGETVTVSVMNGGGKEVMDLGNVALPVTFDTKGLAAGVYLVRVTTPRGTATRRLVVQ